MIQEAARRNTKRLLVLVVTMGLVCRINVTDIKKKFKSYSRILLCHQKQTNKLEIKYLKSSED